jgi:DNA-binding XRE family transcriptional regulator
VIARTVAIEDAEVVTQPKRLQSVHYRHRINVDARGRSFGDRVQDARERAGLTQTQLADAAGLSVQPIRWAEWERGKSVQADTLARIARALNTSIEALWYGEES